MSQRGTMFVFGVFDEVSESEINDILDVAKIKKFELVVFYPQIEQTLERMAIATQMKYFKRVQYLEGLVASSSHPIRVTIDIWEGKRKKYTPIETSVRFLVEKYTAPHFVYMTDEYAYKAASYSSFEEWIRKARLLVKSEGPFTAPERLKKFSNRWELV